MNKKKRAQSTVEYLLVLAIVLGAVIVFATRSGGLGDKVGNSLNQLGNTMGNVLNRIVF